MKIRAFGDTGPSHVAGKLGLMLQSPPVFGKRNVPRPPVVIAAAAPGQPVPAARPSPTDIPTDHAAFFAAVRSELADRSEADELVIPWSFKAASLAGLAVGCALAGFNVTGEAGAERFQVVSGLLGVQVDTSHLLPAMIALGLFAGARVAAATVLCVQAALSQLGLTSHWAYALGGAVASAVFAALMLAVTGHPPAHGWIVELLAGSGGGLCYRAFAGAHPRHRPAAFGITPAPQP